MDFEVKVRMELIVKWSFAEKGVRSNFLRTLMVKNRINKEGFSTPATDEFLVDFLNLTGAGSTSEANVQL